MTSSGSYDHVERLVAGALAGDRESFAELYDATSPRVLGIVSRILGEGPRAEEITARVFESLWSHRSEAPDGAGLPWLIEQGRRLAITHQRSRVPRQRSSSTAEAPAALTPDPAWVPALASEERAALALVYLGGLTTTEADERLGWLPGTTNLTLRQAMLRLAETENARLAEAPAPAGRAVVTA